MANISFITDRLATGGDITSLDDIDDLVAAGITHVIDNRLEWSDEELFAERAPGIVYLHNGVDDAGGRQGAQWYERGVGFALEALARLDTKVLAHCHMGINRGPSMAFAIMLALGWDPVEGFDAIRAARPIAGLAYALDALHHRLTVDGVDRVTAKRSLERLARHERANQIDVARIIRRIRTEEAAGLRDSA
jgi:protein tyrosine phosphatase (PTP) superfamily phosphohydrolase (DUF442 family)